MHVTFQLRKLAAAAAFKPRTEQPFPAFQIFATTQLLTCDIMLWHRSNAAIVKDSRQTAQACIRAHGKVCCSAVIEIGFRLLSYHIAVRSANS
jgi:hypothetical protein